MRIFTHEKRVYGQLIHFHFIRLRPSGVRQAIRRDGRGTGSERSSGLHGIDRPLRITGKLACVRRREVGRGNMFLLRVHVEGGCLRLSPLPGLFSFSLLDA